MHQSFKQAALGDTYNRLTGSHGLDRGHSKILIHGYIDCRTGMTDQLPQFSLGYSAGKGGGGCCDRKSFQPAQFGAARGHYQLTLRHAYKGLHHLVHPLEIL
mgnify:CR=1 FL=1